MPRYEREFLIVNDGVDHVASLQDADHAHMLKHFEKTVDGPCFPPQLASLCFLEAEPLPVIGAILRFFGTVWCGSRESEKSHDCVAVLAV